MSEEELIERLKELKEEGAILGEDEVKILLNLIENSVSKDKIRKINKDLQDKYNKSVDNVYQNPTEALIEFQRLVGKLELIQELLEN